MIKPNIPAYILPHLVSIQAKRVETDALGGRVEAWSTVLTDQRAFIQPLSQAEIAASQQRDDYRTTHRIYLGKLPIRPTPQHRITFGSRIFSVVSATDQGELGVLWELEAEETTPR